MIKILDNIRILQSKRCIGISLYKTSDTSYEIDLVELTKNKSAINISNKESFVGGLDELIKKIPKETPVCISLDGKGILHKIGEKSKKPDHELINSLFPNIKLIDFHYQKHELASGKNYFSIVRQSVIDDIIEAFNSNGIFILGFSLGPVSIHPIISLLPSENPLILKNYVLNVSEGKIDTVEKATNDANFQNRSFVIETEKFETIYILAFSSALSYFINATVTDGKLSETLHRFKEEFTYQSIFKAGIKFVLGLLLATLLVNFIFFSYYNDKNNNLSMQYALQKDNISKLDTLAKKLEAKEKIIKEKKLFLRSKFSHYCDRVGLLVPDEVVLTELQVQPLLSVIEEKEQIEFELSKMFIKGTSNSSMVVGDWIGRLKKEKWAEKVIMEDYNYNNKEKKANFYIKIDISNEEANK